MITDTPLTWYGRDEVGAMAHRIMPSRLSKSDNKFQFTTVVARSYAWDRKSRQNRMHISWGVGGKVYYIYTVAAHATQMPANSSNSIQKKVPNLGRNQNTIM